MSSVPNYRISSGLVHLTRLHSARQSQGSIITASTIDESLDGRNDKSWSWTHLRNEFEAKDAEKLFDKYQVRLQHNFFMVLIMLNIFFNCVAIGVYYYDQVRM